jgi:hypothetical protein
LAKYQPTNRARELFRSYFPNGRAQVGKLHGIDEDSLATWVKSKTGLADEIRAALPADLLAEYEKSTKRGNLYEVNIPEDGEYLLWDKPLSEQPEGVSKALTSDTATMAALEEDQFGGPVMDQVTGRDFYRKLSTRLAAPLREIDNGGPRGWGGYTQTLNDKAANDEAASKALRAAGVRGIKYLDGSSRNTGDGTFNYVIFDDADVEIAARFSRPTSGQEISPGPEFWRKIRAGEPMSPEEIANAYAQGTRSAAPRTFAGMAGASDR